MKTRGEAMARLGSCAAALSLAAGLSACGQGLLTDEDLWNGTFYGPHAPPPPLVLPLEAAWVQMPSGGALDVDLRYSGDLTGAGWSPINGSDLTALRNPDNGALSYFFTQTPGQHIGLRACFRAPGNLDQYAQLRIEYSVLGGLATSSFSAPITGGVEAGIWTPGGAPAGYSPSAQSWATASERTSSVALAPVYRPSQAGYVSSSGLTGQFICAGLISTLQATGPSSQSVLQVRYVRAALNP